MSARRVVVSCVVMALVVGGGSWYAVSAFPLQQGSTAAVTTGEPGPLERSAKRITPENPVPRRLQHNAPTYPTDAAAVSARGNVTLRATLDATGRVAEVRVTSVNARSETPAFSVNVTNVGRLEQMDLAGSLLGTADAARVVAALEAMMAAAVDSVRQWTYDPPADAPITLTVAFGFSPDRPTIVTQTVGAGAGGAAGSAPAGTTTWTTDGAVRVGGAIGIPTKVRDVRPVYPPEAQEARVRGVVIVEARIEADGTVSTARVLRSIPMLDQAALDAVLQWKFTPTVVDGKAVPAIITVTVNFTLQ